MVLADEPREALPSMRGYFIVGGAGFIGSHLVDRLMADASTAALTVYDNFSTGRDWHVAGHRDDRRFTIVRADVQELPRLATAMAGHDTVIHLAAAPESALPPDDAAAAFVDCTTLTRNVLKAMQATGATVLLYASSAAVYGDLGMREAHEDDSPTIPQSVAAAGRLASEALISAYAHAGGIMGRSFRMTEVVGSRQTSGVAYHLVRRVLAEPEQVSVSGDGSQAESFVHIDDVVDAILRVANHIWQGSDAAAYRAYNIAASGRVALREVAEIAAELCGLRPATTRFAYGLDPDRQARPTAELSTRRLASIGWECKRSARAAVHAAVLGLIDDARAGRLEPVR